MPRPTKCRKVCSLPELACFCPETGRTEPMETVIMTVDEYEAIRLIDLKGYTQQACAAQMQVARTTVQKIYDTARRKLADSIVNGKRLQIGGGDYQICGGGRCMECRCGGKGGQAAHSDEK